MIAKSKWKTVVLVEYIDGVPNHSWKTWIDTTE